MLTEKVKNFIAENRLIAKGESVLVAFSGGADSMCLLHILKSLSYNVSAAHLNHMLRGKEADRDQMAAEKFCTDNSIPFYSVKKDIKKIAMQEGVSEETAGRDERYKFFSKIAIENNIDKIATAHNKNDNAETVLMNFLRGSGLEGLSGIPKFRDNIIRPLLCLSREEIEEYCNLNNLHYVTDSTNLESVYTRNKIRLELLPQLAKYNKNIVSALCGLSEIMTVDKNYFDALTENIVGDKTEIFLKDISSIDDAILSRVIIALLKNAGLSYEKIHIKNICQLVKSNKTGKKADVIGGFVELSGGKVLAVKEKSEKFSFNVKPGDFLNLKNFVISADSTVTSKSHIILPMDADISVRSRQNGDKIKVRGMTKKVSDIFTDKKIPSSMRDDIPIVTLNDRIISIVGVENSDFINDYINNDNSFVLNIVNKEYNNE